MGDTDGAALATRSAHHFGYHELLGAGTLYFDMSGKASEGDLIMSVRSSSRGAVLPRRATAADASEDAFDAAEKIRDCEEASMTGSVSSWGPLSPTSHHLWTEHDHVIKRLEDELRCLRTGLEIRRSWPLSKSDVHGGDYSNLQLQVYQPRQLVGTRARSAAVGALVGGVALGSATATSAGLLGTALGAVIGLIPAIFTCGLSVPVTAAVLGSTGFCTGAAVGGAAGALTGSVAGIASHESMCILLIPKEPHS